MSAPALNQLGTPSPHCGRLDQHNKHDWTSPATHQVLDCPGPPVHEGGHQEVMR